MMRKLKQPKYVKPETVHIGDVIRVTHKVGDVEVSTVGKVAHREYQGSSERVLLTEGGITLVGYNPSISMKNPPKVTLLEAAPSRCGAQEPLPGMENIS